MRRTIALMAGAAAFFSLGYVATTYEVSSAFGAIGGAAARVEARLQDAADRALQEQGLAWAQVEMDGQAAILSGTAPREEERAAARSAVLSAVGSGGFWAGGVTVVRDLTRLAPPVAPYEWSAARAADTITLAGAAPTSDAREELLQYAAALFPGGVVDEMEVARGAPDEAAWLSTARTALAQLAALNEGRAAIKDTRLRLDGVAPDALARARVLSAVATLPGRYESTARVESLMGAPEPASVPDAGDEAAIITDPALCQAMFDRLTADTGVRFDSGRSVIDKESYSLLDRLAIAALRCPTTQIRVEGHTDSTGDPSANMRLSLNRAQAVVDYLILKGVAVERLLAAGFGDTHPIAEEASEAGRARNRRIEFVIE